MPPIKEFKGTYRVDFGVLNFVLKLCMRNGLYNFLRNRELDEKISELELKCQIHI